MPGYDGTGPRGVGPMTGGGRGYCALPAGSDGWRPGIGRLFGRGGGRGWRNCYYATGLTGWQRSGDEPHSAGEKEALKQEAVFLKEELDNIQSRINELEQNKEE